MKKVTIKEYAVKHKLSIFNVMKMIRSGTLMTEEDGENGQNGMYILLDNKREEEVKKGIVPVEANAEKTIKEEMGVLQDEIRLLRAEVEEMKKRL